MRAQLGLARCGGALALASLLAGVSTAAFAAPNPKPDPRDARIQQLQEEVQQLVADHQRLQAEDEQLMAKAQQLETEVAALQQGQAAQTQAIQSQSQTIQTVEAKEPPAPTVITNMLNGRPVLASADGRFSITPHLVMQLDTAGYFQPAAGPTSTDFRRDGPALGASATNVDAAHARDLKDGTDFRRARIGLDGTAFGDWDYRLILDFAGSGVENSGQLYESWVQYSGLKPVRFRIGAFPPSIGLEDQGSTNFMPFIERSVDGDLSRGLAAGDTRLAAEVFANGDHWLASGAITGRTIGVLNTGTAAAVPQTYGDQLGLVGRVAISPFYGKDWLVHFGVHGSYVIHPADTTGPGTNGLLTPASEVISLSNTPELRVDGTKFLNTGNMPASHAGTVGAEFAAQKAGFLIQSEYDYFSVQRDDGTLATPVSNPHFQGYYVQGLWMLTGEQRKYNAVTAAFDGPAVAHPFTLNGGGLGAWEVGLRYSDMDLNFDAGAPGTYVSATSPNSTIRGGNEENFSAALNWYPNTVVRFMLDYAYVHIDRLSPATAANSASVWMLPTGAAGAGVQIGQSYSVVSVRSQFAF